MTQIAPCWRTFGVSMVVGALGALMIASGTAAAEPLVPQPSVPSPRQPVATPNQNSMVLPGGVPRFAPGTAQAPVAIPAPPAPAAISGPLPATVRPPAAIAPAPPAAVPAVTGTLREYLQSRDVALEPQNPHDFDALVITLPVPPRWTPVPDPNVPDAFAVIADRVGGHSVYTSNAQVVVYKLVGEFDPQEAITHGFVDSQRMLGWRTTNGALGRLGEFPTSIIEGTYRENDMTLNTSRRHVIATSGSDNYLVSMFVTTAASQVVGDGPATNAIINGFRVQSPESAEQTPADASDSLAPQVPTSPMRPAPSGQAGVAGLGQVSGSYSTVPQQSTLLGPNSNPAPIQTH
ncbi:LpqN/LpqT family lipoprotein [Mycobacterium sp.]|uniref:LpqN/LpqT family lipoprotein n=1 Tax=Mycobacterium sp. TaxID=1785 RepID=UPI003A887605